MKNKILSSDNFIDITQEHIEQLLKLFISEGVEFSIITKPKHIKLNPDITGLFKKENEYIKFDLIGYSFETSQIVNNRFQFRAGFGQGKNIKESEVSMSLIDIFQITSEDKTVFMNFAEQLENRDKTDKVDRSKLFLSKNRKFFGKK